MAINRKNYNKYLLEYFNGNLDFSSFNDLLDFLSANPDLEKQILNTDVNLDLNSVCFPDKNKLKKNFSDIQLINESNFDEFCIADVEGLLDNFNRQRLLDYLILHSEKEKDYKLYNQTKLKPDPEIIFPAKSILKKNAVLFPFVKNIYIKITAAAAIILLIILLNPFSNNTKVKYSEKNITQEKPGITSNNETMPVSASDILSSLADTITTGKNKKAIYYRTYCDSRLNQKRDTVKIPPILQPIPSLLFTTQLTPDYLSMSQNPNTVDYASLVQDSAYLTSTDNLFNLQQLIKKIDIRKTPEAIAKAFNYLTESNIDLYSNFDNNGKLNGLGIKTEIFSFETGKRN